MIIPIIILVIAFLLIAIRQIGNIRLQIWQIMLGGSLAVLITGQISPQDALKAINIDVIIFLFTMFIIGVAMEESGYLSYLSYKIFRRAKNTDQLILIILFSMGIASAILMNDTIAIIGTPIVLILANKHNINPKILMIALAFAITIGSVLSPIGNPQNLLIATEGNIKNPFLIFLKFLFVPTVINLFIAFLFIKLFYRNHLKDIIIEHSEENIIDNRLANLSRISVIILLALILVKIIISFFNIGFDFRIVYITIVASLPILIFSKRKIHIMKRVDWHTLIFFSAMFILMESVWNTGFFQSLIKSLNINIISIPMILIVSVILSQLISNVPLVALYIPMLLNIGASTNEMIALASGSTIAGNFFILGAASNIIIIQNAEKKSGKTITFVEFAKVGVPLTIANIFIYWLFFMIIR